MNKANDLFLLMLNLSQMERRDEIKRIFIEALNSLYDDMSFLYMNIIEETSGMSIPITTGKIDFGYVLITGDFERCPATDKSDIRNAIRMLGVILENKLQSELLASRNIKLEEKIEENMFILSGVIQAVPMFMYIYDMNTEKIVFSNIEVSKVLGFNKEHFSQTIDNYFNLLYPGDKERIIEHFNKMKTIDVGVVEEFEYRIIDNNGDYHWLLSYDTILKKDVTGASNRILCCSIDITKRKEIEEQRDMHFNNAIDMISIAGFDGHFYQLNPAWERELGYDLEYLIERPFMAFVHPDDKEETINQFAKLQEGDQIIQFRNRYLCRNGRYKWLSWNSYSVPDKKVIFSIARNITELMYVEKEKESLLKDLEYKNKELESIVYASSHDLRTPLVNIQGFSREMMYELGEIKKIITDSGMEAEYKDAVAKIYDSEISVYDTYISRSIEKMNNLLNGLLKLSRLGREELLIEYVSMNELLRDVIKVIQHKIDDANAQVTVESLPDCIGDPLKINQVFTNLIDNAIKYRSPDRQCEIIISGKSTINDVTYYVEDNGVGIKPEHHELIFKIFHRLNPGDTVSGEGLGLAIIKRIIDKHYGSIEVESKPGKYSRFIITLPVVK